MKCEPVAGRSRAPFRQGRISRSLLFFPFLFSLANTLWADVIHVDVNAAGANNGSSWTNAFTAVQAALDVAKDGDEIWVAGGQYANAVTKSKVSVYGGFSGTETQREQRDPKANPTVFKGGNHVIASNFDLTLDGFTITGGYAHSNSVDVSQRMGAGILSSNSHLTVRDCTFKGNSAQYGGAIFVADMGGGSSRLVLENCTFSENYGAEGGAIYGEHTGIVATNCVFYKNSSGKGGAFYVRWGYADLRHYTLYGNASFGDGKSLDPSSYDSYTFKTLNSIVLDSIESDPSVTGFVDANDPDGPDGVPRTADDGLALKVGTGGIESGDAYSLYYEEALKDIVGTPRPFGTLPDLGAYEFTGNLSPTAHAGADQKIEVSTPGGAVVALDASASSDPDGDTLTYTWMRQVTGTPNFEPFAGPTTSPKTQVTLPVGFHRFLLIVEDPYYQYQQKVWGWSAFSHPSGLQEDEVQITVTDTTPPQLINVPKPVTVEQSGPAGAAVALAWPTATDLGDSTPTIVSEIPAVFPLGKTVVTFTAYDDSGNKTAATTSVTVVDTTPPTVSNLASQVMAEQANRDGTAVALSPTVTDVCDAAPVLVHNAPAVFPLGTTVVTYQAIDASGNVTTKTTTVTVVDKTSPTMSQAPKPITVEQTSLAGTPVTVPLPIATDICDAAPVVTSDAPSVFPLGWTVVHFYARDASGNTLATSTSVTVVDTTPPTLGDLPAPITVEQTNLAGTPMSLPMPTASDICDASPLVIHDAPSVFPLGTTTVTFTATDASGNSATITTTVTVVDTTPPTLSDLPAPITVEQMNLAGTPATVPMATATDLCDADPVVTSDAPSVFPLGTTVVTFTATDASGNSTASQAGAVVVTKSNVLYGVSTADDGISVVNVETGAVAFVGRLHPDPNVYTIPVAIAVRPSDGKIFVWNNSNGQGSAAVTTGVLLTVDPNTGLGTPVDVSTPPQGVVAALAFSSDGKLFGANLELFEIDPAKGTKKSIGSLGNGLAVWALDFDSKGVLYGLTSTKKLVTLDTATGKATVVAALKQDIGVPGGLAFAANGTLLGSGIAGPFGDTLYEIDPSNGTVSNVRTVTGGYVPQGMAFAVSSKSPFTTTVTVVDTTAPTISTLSASPAVLSPPNRAMVPVTLTVNASDICDAAPACKISSVASNQPTIGPGDPTSPDWEITGDLTLNLRAELTQGKERVYTITVTCTDASGNSSTKTVTVTVPVGKPNDVPKGPPGPK